MNTQHVFYNGVGNSNSPSNSLPIQFLPDSQKNEKWKRLVMDSLESIGLQQQQENIHITDYRRMLNGDLVYSDYGIDDMPVLNKIRELGDGVGIPTYVKHYDFIGIFIRQFIGEWERQKDNFKVDSIDEATDNEFLRALNVEAEDYLVNLLEKEVEIHLTKLGLNPNKKDFQSEEEQQEYLQQLEAERNRAVPVEERLKTVSKSFKTKAVEWAENTLEHDRQRFDMDELESEEMEDYLLSGRYFRDYYVGYDYYKPVRWRPEETFFSKDVNIKYPQDGEYVGRVFNLSPSDVIQKYGHLMKPEELVKLGNRFGNTGNYTQDGRKPFSEKNLNNTMFGDAQVVPFEGYYDYDMALQFQDALETPMGRSIQTAEDGSTIHTPSWLTPLNNGTNYRGYVSDLLRTDFSPRTDLLQVTEAYFRSWKRMWFLNYTTKTGYNATEIVTDDLLPEFIEEYGIKKSRKYSIEDVQDNIEPNTMYEFWIPEGWRGIKVNAGNSALGENLYLGVEPLPYQIKGDSDAFSVVLPVGGIISDSVAKRLRPFQVGYNICMNQIWGLLEKEIGMFFLFDINYLPSEYKDYGDIEESILKLRDFAKDVGIVPMDTSKQAMQGNTPQMNTLMTQEISFDKQMRSRVEMANFFFSKALEQVGVTPTRLGQPNVYDTATGVQQGVTASYDQTAQIFQKMSTARKRCTNLHLAVAQYCQKEYIDKDFVFRASDNDKVYLNLTDPDFPLRRLNVFPINDPRKRKQLEDMKMALLQTNTLGNDILDYAETFFAESVVELMAVAKRSRDEKLKQEETQRAHEQEMVDKQLQAQAQEKEIDREHEIQKQNLINETRLREAAIVAQSKLLDRNNSTAEMQQVDDVSQRNLEEYKRQELDVKKSLAENKVKIEESKLKKIDEDLKLKSRALDLKDKQLDTQRFIAIANKN